MRHRKIGAGVLIAAALGWTSGFAAAESPALTVEAARGMVTELLPEVERLRGLEFESEVPVHVVDEEGLRRHILERLDRFGLRDSLKWTTRAYALLGLVPEDADLLEDILSALEQQVGGFYDPSEGEYYLMDRARPAAARIYTVHELTHALEDQHFDLDSRLRAVLQDDDRLLARGAVHEGSASLLMTLYMTSAVLAGDMTSDDLLEIAESEEGATQGLAALPPVLVRQFLGPYMLGMSFLTRGDMTQLAAGFPVESVDQAFRDGPESSEQILHPDKYWKQDPRDLPRAVNLSGVGKLLGKKWEKKGGGVLGELSLGPLVGATTPVQELGLGTLDPAAWTNEAAAGWGGDRWELWARGSSAVVLWSTVWDSPEDAGEFAEALPGDRGLSWRVDGDRVAVVAGAAGKNTARVLDRMLSPTVVGTAATR